MRAPHYPIQRGAGELHNERQNSPSSNVKRNPPQSDSDRGEFSLYIGIGAALVLVLGLGLALGPCLGLALALGLGPFSCSCSWSLSWSGSCSCSGPLSWSGSCSCSCSCSWPWPWSWLPQKRREREEPREGPPPEALPIFARSPRNLQRGAAELHNERGNSPSVNVKRNPPQSDSDRGELSLYM